MIHSVQTSELAVSVPIAAAPSAAAQSWERKTAYVQYAGGALGTIQVQISPDGTNFYNKGTPLTTSGFVDIPEACTHVRLNTTVAITIGTVSALLAGY